MSAMNQITLTVHGLISDATLVRADVFARKLNTFIAGIKLADQIANGKAMHQLMIADLATGSALAVIREKQKFSKPALNSGVTSYANAITAIYNGETSAASIDNKLLRNIQSVCNGVDKIYSHAEVSFGTGKIIRIDGYFKKKADDITDLAKSFQLKGLRYAYKGLAIGSFDGILKFIDTRGDAVRAILITTAGRQAIECIVPKALVREFGQRIDQRVRIEGAAHYNGEDLLPERVDVRAIREVNTSANLTKWRGAFNLKQDIELDI